MDNEYVNDLEATNSGYTRNMLTYDPLVYITATDITTSATDEFRQGG